MERYEICLNGRQVGSATVERQGLYYKLACCCELPAGKRYHAVVRGSNGQENLGLLIPAGKMFRCTKTVAIKKLGEEALQFYLESQAAEGRFIPLPGKVPPDCLDKLRTAVLAERDGVRGLLIQVDQSAISKPTGQWSEP